MRHLAVICGVLAVALTALPVHSQTGNPIVVENKQPGTGEWQIPTNGYQLADDYTNQIKGYASAVSVNTSESLSFLVTVTPVQTFTIAYYRMGWYGGLGGRLMLRTPVLTGVTQPGCPTVDAATMLIACNWTSSYTLAVPARWTSAVLSSAQGYQNYVPFGDADTFDDSQTVCDGHVDRFGYDDIDTHGDRDSYGDGDIIALA